MSEAANTQVPPRPSLAAKLFLLPFHLFGVLCGSLLLSITVECIGIAFFWPEQGERHAQEWLFVKSGLAEWRREVSSQAGRPKRARDFRYYLGRAFVQAETYVLAAAYVALVFLVRLLVLTLSLPLFLLAAFVGIIDGLVRRDVRRFGAGRESGFVYHRARASVTPLAISPWVLYLALPVSVPPLFLLLPGAALLGIALGIAAATFKKYL